MLTVDRTSARRFRDCGPVIRVTTEPTYEPVSLAAVKRQAQAIDDGAIDDLFQLWMVAAREMVESDSRRALLTQTCKLYLDCFPCGVEPIELERPPIQSVTSVEYYDAAGTLQTLSASLWSADTNSEPGYIYPVYGQSWPITQPQKKGAVIVTFVCGWTDATLVPARARQAIQMLVAYWCLHRETAGESVAEKPLGYESIVQRIKWGPDA